MKIICDLSFYIWQITSARRKLVFVKEKWDSFLEHRICHFPPDPKYEMVKVKIWGFQTFSSFWKQFLVNNFVTMHPKRTTYNLHCFPTVYNFTILSFKLGSQHNRVLDVFWFTWCSSFVSNCVFLIRQNICMQSLKTKIYIILYKNM